MQHYTGLNNWQNTVLKDISKKVNTRGKKLTQSRCFPQWNQIILSLPIASYFSSSFVWEREGKRKHTLIYQPKLHTKQPTNAVTLFKNLFLFWVEIPAFRRRAVVYGGAHTPNCMQSCCIQNIWFLAWIQPNRKLSRRSVPSKTL